MNRFLHLMAVFATFAPDDDKGGGAGGKKPDDKTDDEKLIRMVNAATTSQLERKLEAAVSAALAPIIEKISAHAMADSVEMTSGAARRSGDSKAEDNRQKDVLLSEFGRFAREFVSGVMDLLQVVKGDEQHRVGGGDSFDTVDLMAKVSEAVELVNGLPMKSPTFLRLYLEKVYMMVLKGEVTDKERDVIRAELVRLINEEDMMMMLGDGALPAPPPRPGEGPCDDDEGEDAEGNPRPTSLPLKGVSYKS